jgi:hypothetical protein
MAVRPAWLVLWMTLVLSLSCGKDSPVEPERFTGITETLNHSDPIGAFDPDDWKPLFDRPPVDTTVPSSMPTCTRALPVYPNPANGSTTFTFSVVQQDSILIRLYDRPGHVVDTIAHRRFANGVHSWQIDLHGRELTIHRLTFTVFRPGGTFATHGDIQVIP